MTFITPAAAGNSPDVVTRVVADKLTQLWKQQVIVINRPGAGGLIAVQAASALPTDGYSLYMTQASTFTVLPITHKDKIAVDLKKAFVAVGMVGEQPIAVAVNKDVPANNVAELIALANERRAACCLPPPIAAVAFDRRMFRARGHQHVVRSFGRRRRVGERCHAGRIPIVRGLAGLAPGTQDSRFGCSASRRARQTGPADDG